MTDPFAAARRVRVFLDAWDERHTTRDQVLAQVKPGSPDMLTSDDLRALLATVASAEAAIERTVTKMRDYGSGSVNVRQVINLLSPTWPDGNYEQPTDRHRPLTDEPCGVIPTQRGRRLVDDYRAHRTQQHPDGAADA